MAAVDNKNGLTEEENKNVEDQNTEDESGKTGSENDNSGDDAGEKETETKEKTFTQAQVNKMMTREKNQGRNAVYNELGINPKDSKMVAMVKAMIESQKTDDQKALEKESAEAAALEEANRRALEAEAKAEAMMLGIKKQFVEDAVTLVLAKADDDTDIKTSLGELKTKYPVWFGGSDDDEDDKKKTGQKGTGASVKSQKESKKSGGEETSLGARLAAQRKSGGKNSYWGKK